MRVTYDAYLVYKLSSAERQDISYYTKSCKQKGNEHSDAENIFDVHIV
jgi:hypothetical protein